MIKEKVKYLIRKYGTNDPFQIASEKNIEIVYENLGRTYGYHNKYKRTSIIHINQYLKESMQKFVCAHELGHAIFHPEVNTPFLKENTFFSTDKIEVEAHKFAVELLIPDSGLLEYSDLSIYEIAGIFGVPKKLAHLKKYEYS